MPAGTNILPRHPTRIRPEREEKSELLVRQPDGAISSIRLNNPPRRPFLRRNEENAKTAGPASKGLKASTNKRPTVHFQPPHFETVPQNPSPAKKDLDRRGQL